MAIELPKDANGEVIPFSTTMMYRDDRSQFRVADFFYEAKPNRWFARSGITCIETNKLQLNIKKKDCYEQLMDDSWEKLEEDLGRAAKAEAFRACRYASDEIRPCNKCRFLNKRGLRPCDGKALAEILDRIRRLRGED